jgi:hypothetical protein
MRAGLNVPRPAERRQPSLAVAGALACYRSPTPLADQGKLALSLGLPAHRTGAGRLTARTWPARARRGAAARQWVKYPSADRCFSLQLAAILSVQPAPTHRYRARAWPGQPSGRPALSLISLFRLPGIPMNMMAEDLMTRRQVAALFGVTSAAVAIWARRGRLPEVRNEDGRPRYRRADVEALLRRGLRRRTR